jgi:hypothetical protein
VHLVEPRKQIASDADPAEPLNDEHPQSDPVALVGFQARNERFRHTGLVAPTLLRVVWVEGTQHPTPLSE